MKYFVIAIIFTALFSSCTKKDSYKFADYHDIVAQDSILTNIIINIYKIPRGVRKEDKWKQEHRHLYEKQRSQFQFVYYFHDQEADLYYFYMIRPARNVKGHKRGVAGKFTLADGSYQLQDFEEIFNTPMMSEADILEKGAFLWKDLMYYKNVDRYINNLGFIEFPDKRTRYDKEIKEWVYYEEPKDY